MMWGVMAFRNTRAFALVAVIAACATATPAAAQISNISVAEGVHAGELAVPVNKSQVIRSDRPYAKALIGNPEIADVLPLSDRSLYVLGKKTGTTSLTLYDRRNMLIAVIDVAVGPDVIGLKRQLSELVQGEGVGARMANDSIVLEGIVPSGPAADRAVQLAESYAPGKVINLLSVGSSQQVMLEVRFSEIKRSAIKQLGFGLLVGDGVVGGDFDGVSGGGASASEGNLNIGAIIDSFGILTKRFRAFGTDITGVLDALERKGAVTTLAEPTLVAMSGETASFLAGGEFPVPTSQGGTGDNIAISVEWKPFGVSLAFTPTVLADGVISLIVAPEVSSIDPTNVIVVNNLRIPGLQTRRANTTVELRDGESFAMAGLLRRDFQDTVRQFPILGSIPIIGTLFRSTSFQKDETELVIIVTPRLVRPVRAAALKLPTDRVTPPNEVDLFLLGRTDGGVGANPLAPTLPSPVGRPIGEVAPPANELPATQPGGSASLDTKRLEKDYGHAL